VTRKGWTRLLAALGAASTVALGGLPSFPKVATWSGFAAWDGYFWLLVGLCVISVLCQFGTYVLRGVTRRQTIRTILDYVHKRSWGQHHGGKNPEYRVSFWVPKRCRFRPLRPQGEKALACLYRTDGRRTTKTWLMKPPHGSGDLRDGHGLVGKIWLTEIAPAVDALPSNPNPGQVEEYRRHTCLLEEEYEAHSWKGPAMTGTIVRHSPDGEAIGVLLVECRTPGSHVHPNEILHDSALLAMIWVGRL
jgi:hypothetical protein